MERTVSGLNQPVNNPTVWSGITLEQGLGLPLYRWPKGLTDGVYKALEGVQAG